MYLAIRTAIYEGVLAEGERLRERWLSEVLQVSRTPVREALERLQAEGLVKDASGIGLVVSPLTLQDIENIYTIRICLEGLAAELAARGASESDIRVLEELHSQMESAHRRRNVKRLTLLSREFHSVIRRASKNDRLAGILDLLHDSVQQVGNTTLRHPGRIEEMLREHRALLDAIKRRDVGSARRLGAEHMERAKDARLAIYSAESSRRSVGAGATIS